MYEFAERNAVSFRKCGKLIVALDEEEEQSLARLEERGEANGVEGLRLVGRDAISALEPNAAGKVALLSEETGIIDQSELIYAIAARAADAGAILLTNAVVERIEPEGRHVNVITKNRGQIRTKSVINAAGAWALDFARQCGIDTYSNYFVRGCYATVIPRRRDIVRGLLYPVPGSKLSLGIHFTKTAGGDLLLGPDATVVNDSPPEQIIAYIPDTSMFYSAGKALVPSLELEDIRPGDCGVRTKIATLSGEPLDDFVFVESPTEPYILHLLGIDSPGFTASPAIGEMVGQKVAEHLQ